MYRINQTKGRRGGTTRNLGLLASIVLIAACSSEATKHPSENVADAKDTLLAAACVVDTSAKTVALTVADGEVAYVGKVAGCTVEPCVFVNAIDAGGKICRFDTTAYRIAADPASGASATQKLVLDYTNGLFSLASSATVPTVSTLLTGSTVMVVAPAGGANMALGDKLGVHGLDLNTVVASRATPYVDVSMADGTKFMFNGGAGKDVFTADPSGWTTAPTGWDTATRLTATVGGASTLEVTASGGANDDTLAGGGGPSSTLLGGPGNDTFLQGVNPHHETFVGGDGIDTVDYSIRTAPLAVSIDVESNGVVAAARLVTAGAGYAIGEVAALDADGDTNATIIVDTIGAGGAIATYHVGVGGATYAATAAAVTTGSIAGTGATFDLFVGNDGEVGEADVVPADVEIVKGGSGNDVLTVHSTITTDVVLIGNGGNDKLTGGGGNDDLCGGAGDDTFYENAGNDNLVGGAGIDTADYSGATTAVIACLNPADALCATQNGQTTGGATPEKDVVNAVLAKVCPRATLNIAAGSGTAVTAVPTASQGGPMTVDVENLTGRAAAANTLSCGTLPCTLFGGSAADHLNGGSAQDLIIGMGGADIVTTNGGNDVVDLTHGGGATPPTVNCAGNQVTLLISAADMGGKTLTNCNLANLP